MQSDIFSFIGKSKNLKVINSNENQYIYRSKAISSYSDIISVNYCSDLVNWKDIEKDFIIYINENFAINDNEIIEPIIIYLIEENKYMDELKTIIEIERDEFYCRKFVISITKNKSDILKRLPIGSPFEGLGFRHQFLTARQRLIQMGVNRRIINLLHEIKLKEANYIEIKQYFDTDRKYTSENLSEDISGQSESNNKVRLKSITVKGFRIYNKPQHFNLDADLIVLFGPNGLGKTSLFDAFEYGITGEIRRYNSKENNLNHKNNSSDSNNNIRIQLQSLEDSEEITVLKTIGSRNANLNNEDNKHISTIIKEITQSDLGINQPNLVKLFRATHINSQEDSELTEEALNNNSVISNDLLGKMISFEDYITVGYSFSKIKKIINTEIYDLVEEQSKNQTELENYLEEYNKYSFYDNTEKSDTIEYFGQREYSVRSNRATSPQRLSHPLGGESHSFYISCYLH